MSLLTGHVTFGILHDSKITLSLKRHIYLQVSGVKGASPLAALKGFDLVKSVAIDYMHNVLLGVVKALQDKWFNGDKQSRYYIGKKVHVLTYLLYTSTGIIIICHDYIEYPRIFYTCR